MPIVINDIPAAVVALRQYRPIGVPDMLTEKLTEASLKLSPVDAIVGTTEALYAHLDSLDQEGKELCAALAGFATANGWHNFADVDARGSSIARAALREAGIKVPGQSQKTADDPEPKAEYLPPAPVDAVPAPAD